MQVESDCVSSLIQSVSHHFWNELSSLPSELNNEIWNEHKIISLTLSGFLQNFRSFAIHVRDCRHFFPTSEKKNQHENDANLSHSNSSTRSEHFPLLTLRIISLQFIFGVCFRIKITTYLHWQCSCRHCLCLFSAKLHCI